MWKLSLHYYSNHSVDIDWKSALTQSISCVGLVLRPDFTQTTHGVWHDVKISILASSHMAVFHEWASMTVI